MLNARTRHSRRRRDVDARRGSRAPHRESRTAGRIDTPRRPIHRLGGALDENRTVAEGFIRPHVFLRVTRIQPSRGEVGGHDVRAAILRMARPQGTRRDGEEGA